MSQIEPAVSKRFVSDPHPAGRRVPFFSHKSGVCKPSGSH